MVKITFSINFVSSSRVFIRFFFFITNATYVFFFFFFLFSFSSSSSSFLASMRVCVINVPKHYFLSYRYLEVVGVISHDHGMFCQCRIKSVKQHPIHAF